MPVNHASRMPLPRLLIMFSILGGAILAACGGGTKTVDADEWVDAICDAAADFTRKSDDLGDDFFEVDLGDKDAKDDVVAIFKKLDKLRGDFEKARKDAGKPDVDGGAEIVKAFNKQSDENEKEFDDFLKDVEDIDEDDFEDEFPALMEKLSFDSSVLDELEDLAGDRDTEGAQEIIDLIEDDEDCADVYFESSGSAQEPTASPTAVARQTTTSPTTVARTTPRANASKNEKWVIGLCVGVTSYVDDLEKLSDGLNVPSNPTGAQLKDLMVNFLTAAQRRTVQLKSDIDKLGNPDVKDGAKIQSAMSTASGQVVTIFDGAVRDARALNATDQAKLAQELTALGNRLTAASTGIENAFARIDTDFDTTELTRLASNVPECRGLF